MDTSLLQNLVVAMGLGLLIGLQRQWAESEFGGIRTFPLITVFGAVTATLAGAMGGLVLAAALLALAALILVSNLAKISAGNPEPGMTTEVTALVMFGVGASLVFGYRTEAVVVTGAIAVLLYWKTSLHALVDRIGESDAKAIFQLVLLALVILPVLPNRAYGPYGVLNPHQIWLMVVLIVGISLGAYVAYKLFGARGGTLLSGLMGGLISSTATTVTYSRRSRGSPSDSASPALVVVLASTVVFARVLLELGVVAPAVLPVAGPPLAAMMGFMALVAAVGYVGSRGDLVAPADHEAPSELKAAIVFGLLYAAVIFAVAATKEHFGPGALFGVAALSGLTDMDAITLSTAQLVNAGRLDAATAWRLILVGAMANLVFKGAVVAAMGSRLLGSRIAVMFGSSLAAGALILLLWPG